MADDLRVVPFETLSPAQVSAAADVLMRGFTHQPAAWPTLPEARAEVLTFFQDEDRFALALLKGETLIGWIGAIRAYSHAWELHPIVVDPDHQRAGHGARLIAALEAEALADGVLTIQLGTDDDFGGTSLFGADLWPEPLAHMNAVTPVGTGHPAFFYLAQGYRFIGVVPDANGPGKPDIYMAKRIG